MRLADTRPFCAALARDRRRWAQLSPAVPPSVQPRPRPGWPGRIGSTAAVPWHTPVLIDEAPRPRPWSTLPVKGILTAPRGASHPKDPRRYRNVSLGTRRMARIPGREALAAISRAIPAARFCRPRVSYPGMRSPAAAPDYRSGMTAGLAPRRDDTAGAAGQPWATATVPPRSRRAPTRRRVGGSQSAPARRGLTAHVTRTGIGQMRGLTR